MCRSLTRTSKVWEPMRASAWLTLAAQVTAKSLWVRTWVRTSRMDSSSSTSRILGRDGDSGGKTAPSASILGIRYLPSSIERDFLLPASHAGMVPVRSILSTSRAACGELLFLPGSFEHGGSGGSASGGLGVEGGLEEGPCGGGGRERGRV